METFLVKETGFLIKRITTVKQNKQNKNPLISGGLSSQLIQPKIKGEK